MKKGRNLRSVNTDGGVNLQFKLLSAIGIIIIVSGHCYHGGMELAYNWFPPYSYNLALFPPEINMLVMAGVMLIIGAACVYLIKETKGERP